MAELYRKKLREHDFYSITLLKLGEVPTPSGLHLRHILYPSETFNEQTAISLSAERGLRKNTVFDFTEWLLEAKILNVFPNDIMDYEQNVLITPYPVKCYLCDYDRKRQKWRIFEGVRYGIFCHNKRNHLLYLSQYIPIENVVILRK